MRRTAPLSLQNEFFWCSYEAKVETNCNHPSIPAVIHMTHLNCYELYITISRDILSMFTFSRFHTLLQPLHLRLRHVIRDIILSLAYAVICRLRHAPDVASALADRQLLA